MQHSNHLPHREPHFDRFMNFLGSLETDIISLSDGSNNGDMAPKPCSNKRYAMDWSCVKVVDPNDISSLWSRTFLLHSDWATGIPEFNQLPRQDQAILFKKNYPAFCWMTHAFKCCSTGQARIGLPLGNGSYLPYSSYQYANLHPVLEKVYGIVCQRIIDQVVMPMFQMNINFQEYCILKTLALFQLDIELSPHAVDVCIHLQKKLRGALALCVQGLEPADRIKRIEKITTFISCLMDIGQIEYENIKTLNEEAKS